MKFYNTHIIKFLIIKSIYFVMNILNVKKLFYDNDFDQKKKNYHKENIIEKKLLNNLSEKINTVSNSNNILRQSDELINGKDFKDWYKKDLLYQLSLKYKPTKRRHDYLKRYNYHFYPIRENVRKVLEIGVDRGESLAIWKEYFPNAEIHGLDINPDCKIYNEDRIKIKIGDQSDTEFLEKFGNENKFFDIIIDDGSHMHDHIIKSYTSLFPYLNNGGYYVVEDVVNNYETTNFFTRYAYGINYYPTNKASVDEPGYNEINLKKGGQDIKNIVGLTFYRHLVFLKKGFNPEENPFKNVIEKKLIY